ncbi:IS21 family transposase [Kitasatospora sp. NPDC058965]|uniref:Mu transposase domain-containing protein n=1 Tax=Kitasatospora sp. NPDC058965 TaxID=3346682 RepID=UPI0036A64F3E
MEDPHLSGTVLFTEIAGLGYARSYSTFTRALRKHRLRPPCRQCQGVRPTGGGRTAPPGAEPIRFDWLTLPDPPAHWGRGAQAHLLLGSVGRSGRWRGVLAEGADLPRIVEAMDRVLRRLGGTAECWCLDRMPAACRGGSNRPTSALRQVARYYGARIEPDPPDDHRSRSPERVQQAARSWWGEVARGSTVHEAQASLDRLAARMDDAGPAADPAGAAGAPLPVAETLRALPPVPFPIWVRARRTVGDRGLVPFDGNLYAVPGHLAGAVLEARRRLDQSYLFLATTAGAVIARYALAPAGAGLTVDERSRSTVVLERTPTTARPDLPPCRRNTPRPPSEAALAQAELLRARPVPPSACGLRDDRVGPVERVPPPRQPAHDSDG